MTDWLRELAALDCDNENAVLVTVAGVRGSAPRDTGARMLVTERDARGTIGGGELEYQCTQIATRLLRDGAAGGLRRFPLGSNCGQCCGGVVDVLFEPLDGMACKDELLACWDARGTATLVTTLATDGRPLTRLDADDPQLAGAVRDGTPGRNEPFLLRERIGGSGFPAAVFGAGHVGSAVVQVLAGLDASIRWIDSRRGMLPASLPANVHGIETDAPEREVAALPPGTFYLVMTHSHALDLDITAAILRRGDAAYAGLIGSATKRQRFEKRLRAAGLDGAALATLTCPIGIAGISGKRPAEIAIAVAADLLRRRERALAAVDGRVPGVRMLRPAT